MTNAHRIVSCGIAVGTISCTATNNLYVNNPTPMGRGVGVGYVGIGTGVQAKVDSVSDGPQGNGNVFFSNKITNVPILSFGGQVGLTDRTDLRGAVHFPKFVGGLGIRAGVQRGFFDSSSTVGMAVGTDLGAAFSTDSLGIFKFVNKESATAFNGDVFVPLSFRMGKDVRVVITPRYSFNAFYIPDNINTEPRHDRTFSLRYPAVTLGLRIRTLYLEATGFSYGNRIYPQFGVASLSH